MDDQETKNPQDATRPNPAWRRPYYTILAGQAVSQVGSSAVQFALAMGSWGVSVAAVVAAVTLGIVPVPDHRAEGERPRLHPSASFAMTSRSSEGTACSRRS